MFGLGGFDFGDGAEVSRAEPLGDHQRGPAALVFLVPHRDVGTAFVEDYMLVAETQRAADDAADAVADGSLASDDAYQKCVDIVENGKRE